MNTLSLKKASFAFVAGALLVLPGCWRKKHAQRKIVIETQQPEYIIDENPEEVLVFDDATEQLVPNDNQTYLTANQHEEFNDLDTSGLLSLDQITHQDKNAVVYFNYGTAQLAQSEQANLAAALDTAKSLLAEGKKVVVKGHSCELGKNADRLNPSFSEKRAQTVAHYLTHRGIPAESIVVLGVSAEEPASFGSSKEAQANNRRVEVYGINA